MNCRSHMGSNYDLLKDSRNLKWKENECQQIYSNYVDTSNSDSIDSCKCSNSIDTSLLNSGDELISIENFDRIISISSSPCTPVDSVFTCSQYIFSAKTIPVDVRDSGISSPTFLIPDQPDTSKKKRRASAKAETGYDTLELLSGDQYQSKSLNSKLRLCLPKLSACHQSPSGIGGIVSRIRSLSIGVSPTSNNSSRRASGECCSLVSDSVSPSCISPDLDLDPLKLPKERSNCSLNFTNKNIRNNRKWIRMTHSLSCDVESFNLPDLSAKTSKGRYRFSDEAVYMPTTSPGMNKLERFISGHIDTSTPNGALLSVINQGLRKVSESDRYFLFSKSPLRSPVDFLNSGIEHLGDSDILITVLHHSTCYDLMPENGKMIVLDSSLSVNKAFIAIEDNNINSSPIWNKESQSFTGVLSKDNQMYLLLLAYEFLENGTDSDAYMKRISVESLASCLGREPLRHQLYMVNPENTICSAIKRLDSTSSNEVLVTDSQRSGNPLYILDYRRILTFLLSASQYGLPLPSVLKTTVGVTELMMNRKTLERYKVYLDTNLATLLRVMESNPHHCALVCTDKLACKTCQCTDECVCLLTVDDISLLISKSKHCDPAYQVGSIINDVRHVQKPIVCCDEREPVINIIKSIVEEKAQFALINQDCCKNCIHSIVSSKELLNYIMKHDRCPKIRDNTYVVEKRKPFRSFSCCEDPQKMSDLNLSGVSLDEKEEDVFNMEVS